MCLWRRNALCPSSSCSPCKECAGVYGHHGTFWPDQNQWCTPSCPSFQVPLGSCQAWHPDGWNSLSGYTQYDWSDEDEQERKWRNCNVAQKRQGLIQITVRKLKAFKIPTFTTSIMVIYSGKTSHSTYTGGDLYYNYEVIHVTWRQLQKYT